MEAFCERLKTRVPGRGCSRRREFHRPPKEPEDRLAADVAQGQSTVLPNLRPEVHLPYAIKCGWLADEWVTQLLRQGDAKVFKKYSQMKLQMKREGLEKLKTGASEGQPGFETERPN
jgi:hypothetical protein